jgi:hypothetical protein
MRSAAPAVVAAAKAETSIGAVMLYRASFSSEGLVPRIVMFNFIVASPVGCLPAA